MLKIFSVIVYNKNVPDVSVAITDFVVGIFAAQSVNDLTTARLLILGWRDQKERQRSVWVGYRQTVVVNLSSSWW